MPFHKDKYWQILIQINEYMILTELIQDLEDTYQILLDSSIDICLLAHHYVAD